MKKLICALLTLAASNLFAATAYFVNIDGAITGTTHQFIHNSINFAVAEGGDVVVIRLDTPGGVVESTRRIVREIYEAPIPVVVYVGPDNAMAGSAGTFITLAADFAVMINTSSIGAAHPVSIAGTDIEGDMRGKALNTTESMMRSIAEKRGRNINEAVLTVTESKTFTASEALKAGIIDAVTESEDGLMKLIKDRYGFGELDGKEITPTTAERVKFTLSNPDMLVLLILLTGVFIFLEVKLAGTLLFGTLGAISFGVFLFGANILPINGVGVILIVAGVGMLILELFVASFGILTVGGLVSYIAGLKLLFKTEAMQGVQVSNFLILTTAVLFMGIIVTIGRLLIKDFKTKPHTGVSGLIGKRAAVIVWSDRRGKVRVHGEIWDAKAADDTIQVNDDVLVQAAEGLLLTVQKIVD